MVDGLLNETIPINLGLGPTLSGLGRMGRLQFSFLPQKRTNQDAAKSEPRPCGWNAYSVPVDLRVPLAATQL